MDSEVCSQEIRPLLKVTPNYNTANIVFKSSNENQTNSSPGFEKSHKPKKEYNDPLMKWPVRGLAFTNDIGAAVMDIAPKLGTFLWYPAMMYFGADIYDKYRNDKEEYNPNATRGLKQAIFQALASVVFPIITVHAGQKIASIAARHSKTKLSLQTQEETDRFLLNFMSERKLAQYANGKEADFKKEFKEALDNSILENRRKYNNKNIVSKFFHLIFGSKHPEELGKEQRPQLIHDFAAKKIDKMFDMWKKLNNNEKPDGLPDKLFNEFNALKEKYAKDAKLKDNPIGHAAKDTLKKVESKQIFNVKMLKTLGGFAALGLLIKPIDLFVENVIMHKYVGPKLDMLDKQQVKNFKERNLN